MNMQRLREKRRFVYNARRVGVQHVFRLDDKYSRSFCGSKQKKDLCTVRARRYVARGAAEARPVSIGHGD